MPTGGPILWFAWGEAMTWFSRWILRGRIYGELSEEVRAHLEERVEELVGGGMGRREAEFAARREFGNLGVVERDAREVWRWGWVEDLAMDVRFGLRTLRKNPGFAATAILSLALGIGANTAIFSLMDALMLRWLPVRDPQSLVLLKMRPAGETEAMADFSYAIVGALAERKEIFSDLTGFSGWVFAAGASGSTRNVDGAVVTGDFYETLGLNPEIGRLLRREDDRPGAALVAVISAGYWQREFARDPGVVGRTMRLNGQAVEIVGVSPPGFTGANVGQIADITMAVATVPRIDPGSAPLIGPGNFWLRILARRRADISEAEAHGRLAAVWPGISERVIRADWTASDKKAMAEATFEFAPGGTGFTDLRRVFEKPLFVLMVVVGLVLLIACANVANLLLARATARQKEISVRLAIGAGRGRIVQQLLTESTLLSLIGAAVGMALAWVGGRFLVHVISSGRTPVKFDLTPNWHVLGFTSAVAIATGVIFGLAPALWATTARSSATTRGDSGRGATGSKLLSSLAGAQVALSLVLVIGAGLFVRTLQNLERLNPGFAREGVLVVELEGRRTGIAADVLPELAAIPGVMQATAATHTPLNGSRWSEPAVPHGQTLPEEDNADFVGVGPGFFDAMQTPVLMGRAFSEHDVVGAPFVAVVNETYARRFFGQQNPVGQHLSAMVRGEREELEIVGMVANSNLAGLRAAPPATVYVSYFQLTGNFPTTIVVRASGAMAQVGSEVQARLQARFPDAPIEVRALSTQVDAAMVRERMMASLATGFGALALVLACVGLHGLLAFGVARRTKEMGIRMALGAGRTELTGMVFGNAARLVAVGILVGLCVAWVATRWLSSMLFGLTPNDPATIAAAVILLGAAAIAAAYLPARRAARVDPMIVLRHE